MSTELISLSTTQMIVVHLSRDHLSSCCTGERAYAGKTKFWPFTLLSSKQLKVQCCDMVIGRISSYLCTPVQWKKLRWSLLKSAKQKVMKKDKAGSCCTHAGHPADVLQDRKFYNPLRLTLGGNFSTQDHISAFASSLSKQKGQELMTLYLFQSISKLYICILKSSCYILLTTFYSVKYGSSIITSNVHHIMKTKPLVFPEKWYFKNSSFWHFDSCFVLKHLF